MISQKNIYMDVIYRIVTWQCPVWSDKIEIYHVTAHCTFLLTHHFPSQTRHVIIVSFVE